MASIADCYGIKKCFDYKKLVLPDISHFSTLFQHKKIQATFFRLPETFSKQKLVGFFFECVVAGFA